MKDFVIKKILTTILGTLSFNYTNASGAELKCSQLFQVDQPREQTILEMKGRPVEATVQVNGRIVTLKGTEQPEIERRFTLAVASVPPENILAYLLDAFTAENLEPGVHPFFNLSPLKSRTGTPFHIVPLEKPAESDLNTTDFTAEIEGKTYFRVDPSHEAVNVYVVGKQRERSVYFDTREHSLEKQNIAVRIKEWQPGDGSRRVQPVRRLFVKQTLHDGGDLFTNRNETSFELPADLAETEIPTVAATMLKSLGIAVENLTPIVEIANRRFGCDITVEGKKVGFFTIDQYRSRTLDGKNQGWSDPVAQFEYELLPESLALTRKDPELVKFFDYVESTFSGLLTPQPKYILAQGQNDPAFSEKIAESNLLNKRPEVAKNSILRWKFLPFEKVVSELDIVRRNPDEKIRKAAIEQVKGIVLEAARETNSTELLEQKNFFETVVAYTEDSSREVAYTATSVIGFAGTKFDRYGTFALAQAQKPEINWNQKVGFIAGFINQKNSQYFSVVQHIVKTMAPTPPSEMWDEVRFYQYAQATIDASLKDPQHARVAQELIKELARRLVVIRATATNDARHYANQLLYDWDRTQYQH